MEKKKEIKVKAKDMQSKVIKKSYNQVKEHVRLLITLQYCLQCSGAEQTNWVLMIFLSARTFRGYNTITLSGAKLLQHLNITTVFLLKNLIFHSQ